MKTNMFVSCFRMRRVSDESIRQSIVGQEAADPLYLAIISESIAMRLARSIRIQGIVSFSLCHGVILFVRTYFGPSRDIGVAP